MALKQTIDADIKTAMLAKDKDALLALRAIKSLILLEETKEGHQAEISEDDEIKLLTKAAKQRREAAEVYQKQNREDLATKELGELAIIEKYLPKQLTADELTAAIRAVVASVGATGPADMGKVMGAANKQLAGKVDGKAISQTVKDVLSSL
jgi:uncharacterized protein YqeY